MLNNGSKVNAINPALIRKLGLYIQKTNVGAQKIDGSALKTFEIVIADFKLEDKVGRPRFFQKIFLIADIKFEVVLRMFFLKISNANMPFGERTLTWKSYTIHKALPTTKRIQLVDPKEFVIAVLDTDNKTFVVHVAIQEQEKMGIEFCQKSSNWR